MAHVWHNVAVLHDDVVLDHITESTLRSLSQTEGIDVDEMIEMMDAIEPDDQQGQAILNGDMEKIRRALQGVLSREGNDRPMRYADSDHAMRRYWQLVSVCGLKAQPIPTKGECIQSNRRPEPPPLEELTLLSGCIDELIDRIRKPNDKVVTAYGRKKGEMHLGKFMFWWWVHSPEVKASMDGIAQTIAEDRRVLIAKMEAARLRHNQAVEDGTYKRACKVMGLCPERNKWISKRKKWDKMEPWYKDVSGELDLILSQRRLLYRKRR